MTDVARTMTFAPSNPAATVAMRGRERLDGHQLAQVAAAIRLRLAGTIGTRWGVHLESAVLQIATLTALQSLGRTAFLLPHMQSGFVTSVRMQFDGLICDRASADPAMTILPSLEQLLAEGEGLRMLVCEWKHAIGFLTSGSSGTPTCSLKQPWQIAAEIDMIETAFGSRVGRNRVVHGTTSHQHLFGFTFRVMWPLLTGRAFADAQARIPSDVTGAVTRDRKIVLISSPAFLSRAKALFDFDQLSASSLVAFSSGGPLDPGTALHFNRTRFVSLIEIYGSTETGALAYRVTRDQDDTSWQPLPGVEISINEGTLAARAPHIGDGSFLATQDRAERTGDGGFLLRGRADTIVKVADKRVSLHELERLLNRRPEIEEARVFQLSDGSLAAVVVPTDQGWCDVVERGKLSCVSAWRDQMALHVDRVTTPKRWRLVKAIPRNTQGKVETAALRALFEDRPPMHVSWQTAHSGANLWVGTATIPDGLPELEGHFPGEPIVPGVGQLRWAADAALQHFGSCQGSGKLSGRMLNVKFKRPLLTRAPVRLTIRFREGAGEVNFELADDAQVYSSGRLLW